MAVSDPIDKFAGQGGSYELLPDGTRKLLFRTGLGDVSQPEAEPAATVHSPRNKRQD